MIVMKRMGVEGGDDEVEGCMDKRIEGIGKGSQEEMHGDCMSANGKAQKGSRIPHLLVYEPTNQTGYSGTWLLIGAAPSLHPLTTTPHARTPIPP